MTQETLAEKINKTTKSVQNIEKAKSGVSSETIFALCRELDLDPRVYFCPEKITTPDYLLELSQIISGCTEYESAILTPIVTATLKVIREQKESSQ